MKNGIFTITSEGKTGHYYAKNFAELEQVLFLLWSVRTPLYREQKSPGRQAQQLLSYSKGLLPISIVPSRRLFQPLEQDRFEQLRKDMLDGDTDLCHYTLDFDGNRFAMTSWGEEGMENYSAPMDRVINACIMSRTLRNKPIFDKDFLDYELQRIATTEPSDPELTESSGPKLEL